MNKLNKLVQTITLGITLSCVHVSVFANAGDMQNNVNTKTTQLINTKTQEVIVENTSAVFKNELMSKLKGIEQFSALFEQTVIDNQGHVLQQGGGDLSVKRPNLLRWNTTEPDESLIVSDGESIFLFDPFIEQVTAYKLDGAIENTPILLITSNSTSLWDQYSVSKVSNNNYVIHANDKDSRIKTLEILFNEQNKLSGFTFLDVTGQLSKVSLKEADFSPSLAPSLFKFIMPEGVHLDDQR